MGNEAGRAGYVKVVGSLSEAYGSFRPIAAVALAATGPQHVTRRDHSSPDDRARSFAVLCTGMRPYSQQDAPPRLGPNASLPVPLRSCAFIS